MPSWKLLSSIHNPQPATFFKTKPKVQYPHLTSKVQDKKKKFFVSNSERRSRSDNFLPRFGVHPDFSPPVSSLLRGICSWIGHPFQMGPRSERNKWSSKKLSRQFPFPVGRFPGKFSPSPPLSQSPVGLLYTDSNGAANFFAIPPELFRPHLHSICLMFTAYRSHSLSPWASEPRCLTVVITTMMSWSTFKQALGERTFCHRERRGEDALCSKRQWHVILSISWRVTRISSMQEKLARKKVSGSWLSDLRCLR